MCDAAVFNALLGKDDIIDAVEKLYYIFDWERGESGKAYYPCRNAAAETDIRRLGRVFLKSAVGDYRAFRLLAELLEIDPVGGIEAFAFDITAFRVSDNDGSACV